MLMAFDATEAESGLPIGTFSEPQQNGVVVGKTMDCLHGIKVYQTAFTLL